MLVSILHSCHHPFPALCAYCLRRITGPCHHSPPTLDLVSSTSSPPPRPLTHPQHQHPHHSKPPPTWNCLACFVSLLAHALEQYVSWINGPNPPPSPPTHSPHQLTHPPTRGPMQNNAISALEFRLEMHVDFCGPCATGG